ncbi:MAG: DUF1176 domain-containing protein [Rhizobiales bacterium]|nr:DUF1176 domain-containing protein [Hyphomicrobiales bacterium]
MTIFFPSPSSLASEQSKTVRDWMASCDQFSCTAEVTGEGGLASGGTGYRLRIARASQGGGGWTVELVVHNVPKPAEGETVTVAVAGETLPATIVSKLDEDRAGFADQAALEKIFPALRKGQSVTLGFTSDGKAQSESFSLSGLAAVLLWIDEKQGLVGNSAAVAAYGAASESTELEEGAAAEFKVKIEKLSPVSQCQWNEEGGDKSLYKVDEYDLGDGSLLYAVLCWRGAYQESAVLFRETTDELRVLTFADYSEEMGWGGTQELTSPEFDEKAKTLFTHTKFRGIGDCGSSAQYQWMPDGFKLQLYTYRKCSDEIDENADLDWPVIYKSKDYKE